MTAPTLNSTSSNESNSNSNSNSHSNSHSNSNRNGHGHGYGDGNGNSKYMQIATVIIILSTGLLSSILTILKRWLGEQLILGHQHHLLSVSREWRHEVPCVIP